MREILPHYSDFSSYRREHNGWPDSNQHSHDAITFLDTIKVVPYSASKMSFFERGLQVTMTCFCRACTSGCDLRGAVHQKLFHVFSVQSQPF
jgi:hypothetical protein